MDTNKQCRDDGTQLIVKQTKRSPAQLAKAYYYTAYYFCPHCGKMYFTDEFKVENSSHSPSLFNTLEESTQTFDVNIWTDGACSYNGTPRAKASWAFVSGEYESAGLVQGKQTNNVAEATAILEALTWAVEKKHKVIRIHSDSQISLYNMKKQLSAIKVNQDVFAQIFHLIEKNNLHVTWVKVPGHSDNVNNNRCDKLANDLVGIH